MTYFMKKGPGGYEWLLLAKVNAARFFIAKICPIFTTAVTVSSPSAEGIKTSKCLDKCLCEDTWN